MKYFYTTSAGTFEIEGTLKKSFISGNTGKLQLPGGGVREDVYFTTRGAATKAARLKKKELLKLITRDLAEATNKVRRLVAVLSEYKAKPLLHFKENDPRIYS